MKLKLGFLLATALLLIVSGAALADGSVVINPGPLTVSGQNIDFGTLTASSAAQFTGFKQSAVPWHAVDDRGNGGTGWSVSWAVTDFVRNGGGGSFLSTAAANTLLVDIPGASIVCTTSCGGEAPASLMFGNVADPTHFLDKAAPRKVLSTSLAGDVSSFGQWDFLPKVNLKVPGSTPTGTYVSTWTITIVNTP